jgi:hypothetical protein
MVDRRKAPVFEDGTTEDCLTWCIEFQDLVRELNISSEGTKLTPTALTLSREQNSRVLISAGLLLACCSSSLQRRSLCCHRSELYSTKPRCLHMYVHPSCDRGCCCRCQPKIPCGFRFDMLRVARIVSCGVPVYEESLQENYGCHRDCHSNYVLLGTPYCSQLHLKTHHCPPSS